jgi:hypothetical protein
MPLQGVVVYLVVLSLPVEIGALGHVIGSRQGVFVEKIYQSKNKLSSSAYKMSTTRPPDVLPSQAHIFNIFHDQRFRVNC